MRWPREELATVRPLRRSPLYDRLDAQHALFGSKMGWERPNFFAPTKEDARIDYCWERQNWFPHAAAEHQATRAAVTITDLTSFAKLLLQGRDAEAALEWLVLPGGAVLFRDPERDAAAGAAAVEPEHQARLLRRAAMHE